MLRSSDGFLGPFATDGHVLGPTDDSGVIVGGNLAGWNFASLVGPSSTPIQELNAEQRHFVNRITRWEGVKRGGAHGIPLNSLSFEHGGNFDALEPQHLLLSDEALFDVNARGFHATRATHRARDWFVRAANDPSRENLVSVDLLSAFPEKRI